MTTCSFKNTLWGKLVSARPQAEKVQTGINVTLSFHVPFEVVLITMTSSLIVA